MMWTVKICSSEACIKPFGSAIVFLVLSAWAAFQFDWGWGAHIAPTAAFAAVALVVMLVAFV